MSGIWDLHATLMAVFVCLYDMVYEGRYCAVCCLGLYGPSQDCCVHFTDKKTETWRG